MVERSSIVVFLSLMCLFVAIIVGGYSIYHSLLMSGKPEIRGKSGQFKQLVVEKCQIIKETFSPTPWAGTSLMQTLVATSFRNQLPELNYTRREIIECDDGGEISLDWYREIDNENVTNTTATETNNYNNNRTTPIAILFPGLIGDSQSDYLRVLVPKLYDLGFRVVSFNNRGRGGMKLKSPRLYSAANYDDIKLAIDRIRSKNLNTKIVAAGFSMGGMVLCRYLAELGDLAKVDTALLVSTNYDLVNGTKNMEKNLWNRGINRIMTKALVKILLDEREMLSRANKSVDWNKLEQATSFRELDEQFTCPMWNYSSPDEYFLDATNNERMHKIRKPTLCLNSADDLFSPYETLPLDIVDQNENVVFIVTRRGGHLGFMDGFFPQMPYWGDRLILEYFSALRSSN